MCEVVHLAGDIRTGTRCLDLTRSEGRAQAFFLLRNGRSQPVHERAGSFAHLIRIPLLHLKPPLCVI